MRTLQAADVRVGFSVEEVPEFKRLNFATLVREVP